MCTEQWNWATREFTSAKYFLPQRVASKHSYNKTQKNYIWIYHEFGLNSILSLRTNAKYVTIWPGKHGLHEVQNQSGNSLA